MKTFEAELNNIGWTHLPVNYNYLIAPSIDIYKRIKTKNENRVKRIAIKFYNTESYHPYDFYKPISQLITI